MEAKPDYGILIDGDRDPCAASSPDWHRKRQEVWDQWGARGGLRDYEHFGSSHEGARSFRARSASPVKKNLNKTWHHPSSHRYGSESPILSARSKRTNFPNQMNNTVTGYNTQLFGTRPGVRAPLNTSNKFEADQFRAESLSHFPDSVPGPGMFSAGSSNEALVCLPDSSPTYSPARNLLKSSDSDSRDIDSSVVMLPDSPEAVRGSNLRSLDKKKAKNKKFKKKVIGGKNAATIKAE